MNRHTLIYCLALISAVCAMTCHGQGQPTTPSKDYDALTARAERFFHYKEWANAAATYEVMLDERPGDIGAYAHAIVVAGQRHMPDYQMALMEKSQSNLVPTDSLLANVRKVSYRLGEASHYEKFLQLLRERQPWMGRSIEKQLLAYYVSRRDGEAMVSYSRLMLRTAPDNAYYLSCEAQGYLLLGKYNEAVTTYLKLLEAHPHNYEALLYLGNYYETRQEYAVALPYLEAAQKLHPTPYVAALLTKLREGNTK